MLYFDLLFSPIHAQKSLISQVPEFLRIFLWDSYLWRMLNTIAKNSEFILLKEGNKLAYGIMNKVCWINRFRGKDQRGREGHASEAFCRNYLSNEYSRMEQQHRHKDLAPAAS